MKPLAVATTVLLTITIYVAPAAYPPKSITAPTGNIELIETGGAGTNFAMTEADYLMLVKQFPSSPVFVPMTKKPDGLSPRARFGVNFVLEGRNRAWILDGDDANGYIFYADINANGDLSDDPGYKFEFVDGKYSLRLQLLARAKDGVETYPVIMKLVVDRAVPPGKVDKQLALLMYHRTRRRGQFVFESGGGKPLSFTISGSNGIYDEDYDWIYFDMNRDGTFDPETEGYLVSEKYVNIGDVTYEFTVDRYGRTVTISPQAEKRPARPMLMPGYPAPDFAFVDLQGNRRQLADYRGKVVLLDFWGTWCGPCVAAVPQLVAVYEEYHARGFEIIGIATNDTREKLTAFKAEKQMNWPQTMEGDKGPIATLYRITGWPGYFLVGADGQIIVAAPGGGKIDIAGELAKLFADHRAVETKCYFIAGGADVLDASKRRMTSSVISRARLK
ncbi:MAG: TlpA disulfide reductase family protein [Candidatus Aminicenantales bacterium]